MSNGNQPIFRQAAIQHYIQRKEQSVLPRFVSPRVFRYLWLLLALLVAGGMVVWSAQVPIYASGLAVAVSDQNAISASEEMITLVLFLPSDYQAHLQRGQQVKVQSIHEGTRASHSIVAVESTIFSPTTAQVHFALPPSVATLLNEPVAVAHLQGIAPPSTLPPEAYAGSVYQAEIEIGSRRVITLIPAIEQLWRNFDAS